MAWPMSLHRGEKPCERFSSDLARACSERQWKNSD